MKVIKRDGRVVDYNKEKIVVAIQKANQEVMQTKRATNEEIKEIVKYIEDLNKKRMLVEDIQDIIEKKLMEIKKFDLAKAYIIYRYNRALVRKSNTTDRAIKELIDGEACNSSSTSLLAFIIACSILSGHQSTICPSLLITFINTSYVKNII